MGLRSWLFPSKDERLLAARAMFDAGRLVPARDAAADLGDHPGAPELVEQAEEALTRKNLEDVYTWISAGNLERAREQLDIADDLSPRHTELLVQAADAALRAAEAQALADRRADRDAQNSKLFDINPAFRDPAAAAEPVLPEGVSEGEAEAMRARLAILIDGYPEALRPSFIALGSAFAGAVLDLEDGEHARGEQVLRTLPDSNALVRYELGRARMAQRDPVGAIPELRAFAELAGGHFRMGQAHSGALLAQAVAMSGDHPGALQILEDAQAHKLDVGAGLYAALLEATGRYEDADRVLRAMLSKFGAQPGLYVMLARVRDKAGERLGAMRALETCMEKCACGTGGCGKPSEPDVEAYRMLATMYLEENTDIRRGLELADTARDMVQQPVWEDIYLAALVAKRRDDATWTEMATRLHEGTSAQDPRRGRLEQHLAIA